jgi:isochorismate synthase
MIVDFFQKIEQQYESQLPFVVYCKPGDSQIIGVFQNDAERYSIDDFTEKGFAFVSFDGQQKVLIPWDKSDIYVQQKSSSTLYFEAEISLEYNSEAKLEFEKLVHQGVQAINEGEFQKVVLSRIVSFPIEKIALISIFQKTIALYPNAFCSLFFHPKIGTWIGATPEQLVQRKDQVIKTVALAGTQLFVENETITWKQKEREEQQFVTDFILENLQGEVAEVRKSDPYTFRAGNIVHIKTDIQGILDNEFSFQKLVNRLHPTPAICGMPKNEAFDFIIKNEGYDREFYSGFLGELNVDFRTGKENQSDLFVNLRCMQIKERLVQLYVGCGITKDSNPESEFFETQNKSVTMRKVL